MRSRPPFRETDGAPDGGERALRAGGAMRRARTVTLRAAALAPGLRAVLPALALTGCAFGAGGLPGSGTMDGGAAHPPSSDLQTNVGEADDSAAATGQDPGARVGPGLPGSRRSPSERLVVGAILPMSGSPSNREYARLFLEGVEVAVARARREGFGVEFVVEDNQGTPSGTVRGLSALLARGAEAVLGPLADGNLDAVARAAPERMAVLSPTAARLPEGRPGVYSLGMGDPGAGSELARALAAAGHTNAVAIHPLNPAQTLEADAFAEAFLAAGGIVRRRIAYAPGTTTFGEQLAEAHALRPEVLAVIAPPEDIEMLAPQIAFYGLDTLGLQVAGTSGWTTASVLESVAPRHTDGVISVSTLPPVDGPNPGTDFVAAYEERYRRTLRSSVPAAGFDLFRLAVDAWQRSSPASGGIAAAIASTERFAGATGAWSLEEGRLVREFHAVRIREGGLRPLDSGEPLPESRETSPSANAGGTGARAQLSGVDGFLRFAGQRGRAGR